MKSLTKILIAMTLTLLAFQPGPALADDPFRLFLPIVFGRPVTPPPSTTEPVMPVAPLTGGQTLWPAKAAWVASQWADYPSAMAGSQNVAGTDRVCQAETPVSELKYGLTEQHFFGVSYIINRQYVEFDTTAIPPDFEAAQLSFTNFMPYPGPPAHHIAVHRGAWADLAAADCNFHEANWNAWDPARLVTLYGGDPNAQAWQSMTFDLPRAAITPGGITRLVLRTTTEGTVPVAQLGGAFGSLSLTIKTAGADESN
ncbi:MAG: hypothetical protein FOGNACKC_05503 [Anaerolineae bacterium]|nr:hypothetical protein [Anaerolineae bacterium]